MSSSSNQNSLSATDPAIEFRAFDDDAWYSVRVVTDGEKLVIKYCDFPDEHDSAFISNNFQSLEELLDFEKRFRPISAQLQDSECSKVVEGMVVCAFHSYNETDIRYYDAVIDEVKYQKHSFANGEEECLCTFLLFWQHGPNAGNLTVEKIANLCLINCWAQRHPTVASFIKTARKKIESASCKSSTFSNADVPTSSTSTYFEEKSLALAKHNSTFAQRLSKGKKFARKSVERWPSEGRILDVSERQDIDLGGFTNYYILLIDNLEKELSPATITEFIHKQTLILSQSCIFPSLQSESYTRGVTLLDCKKDLRDLYAFLENPNHIIVSARGRPWVVSEKVSRCDTIRASTGTLIHTSQTRSAGGANELKLVYSGTKEYKKAEQLRNLFRSFSEHQERLHKRLALEERNILQ